MKRIGLKLAILALVSSAVPSFAQDLETVSIGEALAGRNCTWCHGPLAQGFATAPQLAGQKPAYLENQLRSFNDHSRDNPLSQQYMWGAAAKLNSDTARDLAAYFATVEPRPAEDGDEQLVPAGKQLYEEGNPEGNLVPCISCHGPGAQGVRDIPRLSRPVLSLLEAEAHSVGRRVSFVREGAHARNREQVVRGPNLCHRVVSQLCEVEQAALRKTGLARAVSTYVRQPSSRVSHRPEPPTLLNEKAQRRFSYSLNFFFLGGLCRRGDREQHRRLSPGLLRFARNDDDSAFAERALEFYASFRPGARADGGIIPISARGVSSR